MTNKTTWRTEIEKDIMLMEGKSNYTSSLSDEQLDQEFCAVTESKVAEWAFTAWTDDRVYYPVRALGEYWIESVPRHPHVTPPHHQYGWGM